MKTFRELISWELEQEKPQTRSGDSTLEDRSGKLGSLMVRRVRYLSAARAQSIGVEVARPSWR